MGTEISKPFVNLLRNGHVVFGCGLVGILATLFQGKYDSLYRFLTAIVITGAGVVYVLLPAEKKRLSKHNVIFITGCDSGLGYALARHLVNTPVTVVATFLNANSEGAQILKELYNGNFADGRGHFITMDITKTAQIESALNTVCQVLRNNPRYELTAIVNNSGVMAFGEFEWQTDAIIKHQLAVNLLGSMELTHRMLPLIRKNKSRIVTVTSHCALECLPGLSVYSASKKALAGWMDAIRVELQPYGIHAVSFIPGSFVMASNISARQNQLAQEMRSAMSCEQRSFYGEYFDRYNNYLSVLSGDKPPGALNDEKLLSLFECALFDVKPKAVYKFEPPRYTWYYGLMRWSPCWIRDLIVLNFVAMPRYIPIVKNGCEPDLCNIAV